MSGRLGHRGRNVKLSGFPRCYPITGISRGVRTVSSSAPSARMMMFSSGTIIRPWVPPCANSIPGAVGTIGSLSAQQRRYAQIRNKVGWAGRILESRLRVKLRPSAPLGVASGMQRLTDIRAGTSVMRRCSDVETLGAIQQLEAQRHDPPGAGRRPGSGRSGSWW